MKLKVAILLAFIACLQISKAQSPVFESVNLGEGKKTLKVQAIAQDGDNHLYYGTNNGLIHFNGIEYVPIEFADSLGKVSVTALTFYQGSLWIGTSNGKILISRHGELSLFNHPDFNASAKVTALVSNGEQIGVSTYGDGIYVWSADSETIKHVNSENGLGDDYTYDLEWQGQKVWIGTDAGITELNVSDFSTNLYSMKNGLPDNIVRSLCLMNDSALVVGMHDLGVGVLNTKTYAFSSLQQGESQWTRGPVEELIVDATGRIWVGTKSDGLVCYQIADEHRSACKAFTEINGLGSNRVLSLMEDAEQNIWIGTNDGVSLYSGSTFEYLTANEGLIGVNIYDVMIDRIGNIWLASDKGVMRYTYSDAGEGLVTRFLENDGSLDRQIVCLMEDSRGMIWMGSYGSGLFKLDPSTNKISNYTEKDGLENTNVLDLAEDARGRLWLATLGGSVARVDFESGHPKFTHIFDEANLKSKYIYTLLIDNKQQLWIGSDGSGVGLYDCKDDYFKPGVGEVLDDATVFSIAEGPDDQLWFATSESGLYCYSKGALTNYGESAGLRSNSVVSIQLLSTGEVIAVHSLGIDVLPNGEETFVPYYINKPSFYFEPNLNASDLKNDALWIGSEGGVVKFTLHDRQSVEPPKVAITGLRVLYEDVPLQNGNTYEYDENHFVFDYLAIWMKNPEAIKYKYILEGFDKQWSFETQSRVATYSSLPPGNYIFRVAASSGNGVWSDPDLSTFSFTILRPFWMQWWFYATLIAVLLLAVGGFIRYRTQKLIADKKQLEDEVEKRTKEIRDQKEIIEFKNEEILSSITYAKRIQSAILPPDRMIKEFLPDSFVLYKPKDIVAGDFYWMEFVNPVVQIREELHEMNTPDLNSIAENGIVLIASADCTGHGVPGAMVSVVCHNAMNRAVREYGLVQPSIILDKTRELVIEQFQQSEEDVKDGMDVALCAIYRDVAAGGQMILEYSGAQNPLWFISNKEELTWKDGTVTKADLSEDGRYLHELKPDKQPIGKYAETKPFTNHSIEISEGDAVYIFTDGYADQFGGERGKKFKYKPMKRLVLSFQTKQMDQQHRALDEQFESWRRDLEQVDDVCVIGIRFPEVD